MAVEKKEVIKAVEAKEPVAAKAPAKKETVKKEAAPKKEAVKKDTVEKAAEKKAPVAKKPAAKKTEPKATVVIEYAGSQIAAKDVLATATKAFTKSHKGVAIKTIDIYVKPEEHVAYYVVNGEGSDDYRIEL